mmetsp:Transcript_48697/g.128686  ORF Transcript_48697/g.128686 Transcript_48697/m.128686 type:complete len:396 (+) Transcript_48697:18-1205(+)
MCYGFRLRSSVAPDTRREDCLQDPKKGSCAVESSSTDGCSSRPQDPEQGGRSSGGASDGDALGGVELGADLGQLLVRLGVVVEEGRLGLGVLREDWLEGRVGVQGRVRRVPEEVLVRGGLLVRGEVAVVEGQPVLGPGGAARHAHARLAVLAGDARGLGVLRGGRVRVAEGAGAAALLEGAADGVRPGESHDLLVGEAHLLGEDVAEVRCRVRRAAGELAVGARLGVGQARVAGEALAGGGGHALIRGGRRHAAVLHGDLRAAGGLDGHGGCHLDEVRPRHGRVLLRKLVEVALGLRESGVRAHAHLGVEADGAVGAAALRPPLDALVEGARVVPREADEDGVAVQGVDEALEVALQILQLLDAAVGRAEGGEATLGAGVSHGAASRRDGSQRSA